MTKRDGYQRYLDAGIAFTQMTRSRAEELVQELVKSGEVQGKEARTKVEELIERSRKSSESLLSVVRDEVGNQLHSMGVSNIEDLAKQVASLLGRSSKAASGAARKSAAKKAPAKKAAAKKAPAKKAAAKKAAAKKAPAKKAPAKKASGPRSRA
jgi:polyhydroxyalkanoate synthesis regulator phasin